MARKSRFESILQGDQLPQRTVYDRAAFLEGAGLPNLFPLAADAVPFTPQVPRAGVRRNPTEDGGEIAPLQANTLDLWRMYTASTYASGDLPVLATREALQNALDATQRSKPPEGGKFSVTWDPSTRSITWEDNGGGMTEAVVRNVFLNLATTTKTGPGSTGGFGVAKAVILGCGADFHWDLYTQDLHVVGRGWEEHPLLHRGHSWVSGVRLTVHNIPEKFSYFSGVRGGYSDLPDRLRDLLAANTLRMELRLNDQVIRPLFPRSHGRRFANGVWGGTPVDIRVYRRPDRAGRYYFRLRSWGSGKTDVGGLFQFARGAQRGQVPFDVVVDMTPPMTPKDEGYPLTNGRDALKYTVSADFLDLAAQLEKETESAGGFEDDEVYEPDYGSGSESLDSLGTRLGEFAGSAEFLEAFRMAQQTARGAARAQSSSDTNQRRRLDALENLDRLFAAGDKVVRERPDFAGAPPPIHAPRTSPSDRLATAPTTAEGVSDAMIAAFDLNGGGVISALAVLDEARATLSTKELDRLRFGNPFRDFAGLRIGKNFPRGKVRAFRKAYGKWLPYLTVWDATLRLIAAVGTVERQFRPGFILHDEVIGLASRSSNGRFAIISVNPYFFQSAVRSYAAEAPHALAMWVHGVAVHELAHVRVGFGEAHNETYATEREALADASAPVLPAIMLLCSQFLGAAHPCAEELQTLARVEARLARQGEKKKALSRTDAERVRAARAALEGLENGFVEALRGAGPILRRAEAVEVLRQIREDLSPELQAWVDRRRDALLQSLLEAMDQT